MSGLLTKSYDSSITSNCAPTFVVDVVKGVATELFLNVSTSPAASVNIVSPLVSPVAESKSMLVDASTVPFTAIDMVAPVPAVMLTA